MASAEARVERLFVRLSRIEVPVWNSVVREADPEAFQDAREIALARADKAGRRDLLNLARERVALAYAHHLAGLGYGRRCSPCLCRSGRAIAPTRGRSSRTW